MTVVGWEETEDPMALVALTLEQALDRPAHNLGAVAVSDGLRAAFVLGLQRVLPGARFSLASAVLRSLRMRKDPAEVELMRLAAHAADRVIASMAAGRLVGRTEADVAREVIERLVAEGHEHAEFSIVASGPNSASPHHHPGDRVIEAGEPIVFDIGGTIGGYASDMTRMVWVTGGDPALGPDDEFRKLYGVLQDAQAEATGAARPGVACERVDAVARGDHRRRRLRPAVHPPHGPRHRARGPRGAVSRRGQRRAARARDRVQRGAGDLPRGPLRRPDRGHRGLRRVGPDRAQRGDEGPAGRRRLTRRPPRGGIIRRSDGNPGRTESPT